MRYAEISRKTAETDIRLSLNLDGDGTSEIDTGCGFLDHMLTLFAKYADEIGGEVLATAVEKKTPTGYTKEWNINGEKVTLGVEK